MEKTEKDFSAVEVKDEAMVRVNGGEMKPLKELNLDKSKLPESTPLKFWKKEGSEKLSVTASTNSEEDTGLECGNIDQAFKSIVGVKDADLAKVLFCEGVAATTPLLTNVDSHNFTAQSLHDIQPKSSIEARLAIQATALFSHGLTNLRKSETVGRTDHADHYANKAVKFLRLHNETIEALSRYRRGGEQKINVTHALLANNATINNFTGEGVVVKNQGGMPCSQKSQKNAEPKQEPTTITHVDNGQWQTADAGCMEVSAEEQQQKKGS